MINSDDVDWTNTPAEDDIFIKEDQDTDTTMDCEDWDED